MTEQKCVRTYNTGKFNSNETRVCCEELNPYLEEGWMVVFITPKADYIEYIIEKEVDNSRMERMELKSYEGYINDIPLVIDPCKQCKNYKKHKGWSMGEFKNGEWEEGACKECCWFYDSEFEVEK